MTLSINGTRPGGIALDTAGFDMGTRQLTEVVVDATLLGGSRAVVWNLAGEWVDESGLVRVTGPVLPGPMTGSWPHSRYPNGARYAVELPAMSWGGSYTKELLPANGSVPWSDATEADGYSATMGSYRPRVAVDAYHASGASAGRATVELAFSGGALTMTLSGGSATAACSDSNVLGYLWI